MKICFLCSCLEPGRDGVGDYTRLLANACEEAGHSTQCLALRDPFAAEGGTHRFSNALENLTEQKRLIKQIDAFDPDWVSLQFVPYGLHPKGLPTRLPGLLRACLGSWRWHVMFHEIWIGCKLGSPAKERLVGFLQKRLIAHCMRIVSPVTHTHADPYRVLLNSIGLTTQGLPLFSNLPVSSNDNPEVTYSFLNTNGIAISADNRDLFYLGGLFGTLHPEWPPEPLLGKLREAARLHGKRIFVIHFGGIGPGKDLWESLMRDNDEDLTLLEHGRMDATAASQLMKELDFGLASSPRSLIQKSGSVAALRAHGLPVIINRDEAHYPGVPRELPLNDPLLIPFADTLPEHFFDLPHRTSDTRLALVAEKFLHDIGV